MSGDYNPLVELFVLLTIIAIFVGGMVFVKNKPDRTANETTNRQEQKVELPAQTSILAPVSYTFVMKDGTTNFVDLTKVKEMNTNYDFIKKEN